MTTKYYLKEKCECDCHYLIKPFGHNTIRCNGYCKGFIRGADVTEFIEHFILCEPNGWNDNTFKELVEVVEE